MALLLMSSRFPMGVATMYRLLVSGCVLILLIFIIYSCTPRIIANEDIFTKEKNKNEIKRGKEELTKVDQNTISEDQTSIESTYLETNNNKKIISEIEIILPKGYTLEAAFDPIEITTVFGTYNASVELSASNTILYKRHLQLLSGTFPSESFNDYASFVRNVTKKDKSKIVLSKI